LDWFFPARRQTQFGCSLAGNWKLCIKSQTRPVVWRLDCRGSWAVFHPDKRLV